MPKRRSDATRDPESMTTDERLDEIAEILARGALRTHAESAELSLDSHTCSPSGLEVSGEMSLSVCQLRSADAPAHARRTHEETPDQ